MTHLAGHVHNASRNSAPLHRANCRLRREERCAHIEVEQEVEHVTWHVAHRHRPIGACVVDEYIDVERFETLMKSGRGHVLGPALDAHIAKPRQSGFAASDCNDMRACVGK
jgi:hypothetical protein